MGVAPRVRTKPSQVPARMPTRAPALIAARTVPRGPGGVELGLSGDIEGPWTRADSSLLN